MELGAWHVVITDVNPTRLSIAEKMGVSLTVDVRTSSLTEATTALGMQEGFDVGLEMSGNPAGFRQMLETMVAMQGDAKSWERQRDHLAEILKQ